MIARRLWIGVTLLACMPLPAAAQQRPDPSSEMLSDLGDGRRSASDLTPVELAQLRERLATLRASRSSRPRTTAECMRRNATSERPSDLEAGMLDLKCSRPELR